MPYDIDRVYKSEVNGLEVRTGDLICTVDGGPSLYPGQFWRFIGRLIPGDVDHIAVYVGPGGRCVEAGARGKVICFDIPGLRWDGASMFERRNMVDDLFGIACPFTGSRDAAGREDGAGREDEVRLAVARYCLEQARAGKPYNLNFLDSSTEDAFYCSQLAYLAYLPYGIDFNTGLGVPDIPFTGSIIFPQEVWSSCPRKARP